MFRTVREAADAAVDAAVDGIGPRADDFDTQDCKEWQEEILVPTSSSPIKQDTPLPPHRSPSPVLTTPERPRSSSGVFKIPTLPLSVTTAIESSDSHSVKTPSKQVREPSGPDANEETNGEQEKPEGPAALGNDGRLRPIEDKKIPSEESPSRKHKMDRDGAINMNDLTQKSSMSLTQPNSASAYELYTTAEETARPSYAGVGITDRTPNTYDENDTGHIILNLDHTSEEDEDEAESQDASYEAPIAFSSQPIEPQTPAPPVNPFDIKGTVLKPHAMFNATQFSSIGRHMSSPTSSRPSPNGFAETPVPFQIADSPLIQRQQLIETPIQHSSLFAPLSSESPIPAAFNRTSDASVLPRARALPEPRRYSSMKESQEKREPQDVESSDDSDIEAEPHNRSRAMHKYATDQLSRVTIGLHNKKPTWGEPPSSYASAVEVPSTGRRRRSVQEEYTAQGEGFDARDTQQDGYVADSQAQSSPPRHSSAPQIESTEVDEAVAHEAKASTQSADSQPQILPDSCDESNGNAPRDICATTPDQSLKPVSNSSLPSTQAVLGAAPETSSSEELPKVPDPAILPEVTPEEPHPELGAASSLPSTQALPPSLPRTNETDLPLKEVCANQGTMATPTKQNQSSGSESLAIPETSPIPGSSLRPMGDIGISFAADQEDELQTTPPGFSPDPEYEAYQQIVNKASTPKKVAPLRKKPKSRTSTQVQAKETEPSTIGKSELLQATDDITAARPTSPDHISSVTREVETPKPNSTQQQDGVMEESQSLFVSQEPPADFPEDMAEEALPSTGDGPAKETEIIGKDMHHPEDTAMDEVVEAPVIKVKKRTTRSTKLAKETEINDENMHPPEDTATNKLVEAPVSGVKKRTTRVTKPPKSAEMAPPTPNTISSTASSDLSSVPSSAMHTPRSTPLLKGPSSSTRPSVTRASSATKGRSNKKPKVAEPPRKSKRKASALEETLEPTRSSKRQSVARVSRSSSIDPLSLPSAFTGTRTTTVRSSSGLFSKMVFAVSYDPKNDKDKEKIKKCIEEQGGRLLEPGFANMFTAQQADDEYELGLTPKNKGLRFAAVIADEFSRKVKYMEALALGLPCISGQWVLNCIAKETVIDWSPYLLCAGRVEYLNDAHISRNLASYSAATSDLSSIIGDRVKVLAGKSILIITSRAESDAKGKTVDFLLQASGPSRCLQVSSVTEARKRLQDDEAEGTSWDLIFSYGKPQDAEKQLFSANPKRKRGSTALESDHRPAPSKVRVLVHEEVLQSVITGRLLDD